MNNQIYYLIEVSENRYRFSAKRDLALIIEEAIILKSEYTDTKIIGYFESDFDNMKKYYDLLKPFKIDKNFYKRNEDIIKLFQSVEIDKSKQPIKNYNNLYQSVDMILRNYNNIGIIYGGSDLALFIKSQIYKYGIDLIKEAFSYSKEYIAPVYIKEVNITPAKLIKEEAQIIRNKMETVYLKGIYKDPAKQEYYKSLIK